VSENVGLEKFAAIKMERGFVLVDPSTLLTGEGWVSAIGDVVAIPGRPHPQLAHLAFVEGEFVADKLAGKKPHPVNYDLVPGATYSEPEVASIGLTGRGAKARGYKVKVGTFPFSATGKDIASRMFNSGAGRLPMSEATSWRRGFAAGFAALALSVAGHVATAERAVSAGSSCSLSRSRLADRLADRVTPNIEARCLAQRVARLVLGAVLAAC